MKREKYGFWSRAFALLLALLLVVPNTGMRLAAAEDEGFEVSGSKVTDPTELEGDKRTTRVTLSLPSGEYKYVYDVVFVMDSSSSTANSNIDFSEYVINLLDAIKEKNAVMNVGVIKVRGLAFDTVSLVSNEAMSGMVEYSEDTKQTIVDAINYTEAALKALSSGTNIHGGLDMANDWLSADTEVPDTQKYVFLLTDGKTYIWNDENDVPTTNYGQYMAKNKVYGTPAVGQQTIAYSKSAYKFVDNVNFFSATSEELANLSFDEYFEKTGNFYANDFAKLYASTNAELSEPTKYDYRCGYAYKESANASGTLTEHAVSNAKYTYALHNKYYEFVPDESFADLNWLQANPYTVEVNEGVYSYTETVNPDFYQLHPDSLQKGLYLTAHLWTDMVEKYNGAVINYNGWGGGSGLEIAKSFNEWIKGEGISDYAADIANADSVTAVFDSVKDDILYMVSKGTVTDVIGEDFSLKNTDSADCFAMTLNGEELAVNFADGVWNFGEAVDGVYPYSITFDGTDTITWTINVPIENAKPITLSYDLELREDATPGTYETNESAILSYKSSDGKKDGTYTFDVPTVDYKLLDIFVTKTWVDADDQDGIRPDSVTVHLYADDVDTTLSAVLSEDNDWSASFTNQKIWKLDEATGEYSKVVYTIVEDAVEDYEETENTSEVTPSGSTTENDTQAFTIENTHAPETKEITVTKVWEDADNQDGKRPNSVNFTVTGSDGKTYDVELVGKSENTWTATVEVEKYMNGGQEVTFTVDEADVTDYIKEINNDSLTITNTYTPETTEITVTKIWDDASNQDGKRPAELKVTVTGSDGKTYEVVLSGEEDTWTETITVDKYFNGGELVTFTVDEEDTDYEKSVDNGTLTITNTYEPETRVISGTIFWVDDDDRDGVRPTEVVVNLYSDAGVAVVKDSAVTGARLKYAPEGMTVVNTLTVTEADGWKYEFEVPVYQNGKKVSYAVEEEGVPEYTINDSTFAEANKGQAVVQNVTDDVDVYDFTDTHIPETLDITVTKTWDDADNQDGIRPESITVNLLANGEKIDSAEVKPDADGNWSYTFEDVYKYEGGEEIAYTVTEETVDGYEADITEFAISNVHEPEVTSVKVTKVWGAEENPDVVQPESVTIHLFADGEDTGLTLILSESNSWTGEFTDVPVYKNGETITYTVDEDEIDGYIKDITGDAENGFTVTNTPQPYHNLETTDINVTKVWDDDDDKDGIRPESVKISLLANGEVVETATLNAEGGWKYTFEAQRVYDDDNNEIVYTVEEDAVADYEASVSGDAKEGFTVTNTHEPKAPEESSEDSSAEESSAEESSEEESSEEESSEEESSAESSEEESSEESSEEESSVEESSEDSSKPDVPATGDSHHFTGWIVMMLLAAVGFAAVLVRLKREEVR